MIRDLLANKGRFRGQRGMGWMFKAVFIFVVACTVLSMFVVGGIYLHYSGTLPSILTVEDYRPAGVTQVFGSDGTNLSEMGEFLEERRYLIPYEKIPDIVVKAFTSAEDDRFFEHSGINITSIIRASIANFRAGHVVQGGSTITQQVAKSLLKNSERSFDRKIKEIILASRIERNLTKQQILYLYLNQIYLGHRAYGVQAASKSYFKKDIGQISLAECALLAGMPQAPGKYSPLLNPKKAKERQLYVLRRMFENKYITQAQLNEASTESLRIFGEEDINSKYAPYYVEFVRKYLLEKYGKKAVFQDGLTVTIPTTPELSLAAKKSVRDGLMTVDKRIGFRGPIQHLKSSEEIEKFLEDMRLKLIEDKLHFQLFLPDGKIDQIEAMHFAGLKSDMDLIDPNQLYKAVVTGIDNSKKIARVMVGAIQAQIPMDKMKWAHAPKDDKRPNAFKGTPTLPSQILQKGDVVWVYLSQGAGGEAVASLEQEPQIQGALISMDVRTGYVLAMVGGYDFDQSEFNRAVQAMRQPGSAFKPIIYSAALEKGYTPTSIIVDSPIVFKDNDGSSTWKPSNFEEKFYGDTTFRQALIKSRNIPTVKIVQSIQVPYLIDYAKRLGMNTQFSADLSISLGSAAISLVDMTKIYTLFPRLGRKVSPVFITKVVDRDGRVLEEVTEKTNSNLKGGMSIPEPTVESPSSPQQDGTKSTEKKISFPTYPLANDPDQVLDPRVAYVMTHLMKEVVTYGTGHEAKNLGRPAAGKTGTTNESMDAWFMGFTPYVSSGVWVGFDSVHSIGPSETGARVALPIWLNFMKEAVKPYPNSDFNVPSGITFATIDAASGKLTSPNSSLAIKEAFIDGTQPTESVSPEASVPESQVDFFKEDKE